MKNKMTITELKQYIIIEAKKLMKVEILKEEKAKIIGQLNKLDENEETKLYKFKVKHDNGSSTIKTNGSSESAAKKKIAQAEGCPESAITLIKENEFDNDFGPESREVEHGINSHSQEDRNISNNSNLEEFRPNGTYTVSNSLGYYIQVSDDGESARVQNATDGDDANPPSEWLEIKWIANPEIEQGDVVPEDEWNIPVIDPDGYDIPLNQVMKLK